MDEKSQLLFQALLKNALWETPITLVFEPNSDQWNRIMNFARKQAVTALIAEAILRNKQLWNLDDAFTKKLQMCIIRNVQENERLNEVLAQVVSLLRVDGIPSVLLKGQGVALNYIKPELRCCGDIDLYIGEGNYEKACQFMAQTVEDYTDASESHKHLHVTYKGVCVELHRIAEKLDPRKQDTYLQKITVKSLEKSTLPSHCFNGVDVNLPTDEFNAFYIFEHLWHHFLTGGVGLRQLCDWVRFLHTHAGTIDRTLLETNLKHMGLWTPWLVFASIAVEHLGLPTEDCPFYNVLYSGDALRIMRLITREGNFGKYNPERRKKHNNYITRKYASFRLQTHRYFILSRIFPKEIFSRYGYFLNNSLRRVILEMYTRNPDAPRTARK